MKQLSLLFIATIAFGFTQIPYALRQCYIFDGTWKMTTKNGTLYESWSKPNNFTLKSTSYKVKANGDTVLLESVVLTQTRSGVFYNSTVKDQNDGKAVPFKLSSINNKTFVFTNEEHDYPKRIVYEFIGTDSLHAWIDGGEEEKTKRNDFYYKKQ